MCKHSELYIGQVVDIFSDNSSCSECGNPWPDRYIPSTFKGHVQEDGVSFGVFAPLDKFFCPGCGNAVKEALDLCGSGYYLQFETAIPVEDWPIKKEVIK